MKTLISLFAIVMLSACHGKAENVNATSVLEQTVDENKTTDGIPVGVYELPANMTYDINQAPGHLVVIDFNASWCVPCLRFAPIFEQAAQQFAGEVEFISVNVEQHQELVQQLGITSIPYIVFIQPDGKINSWVGFLPEEEFIKAINELK